MAGSKLSSPEVDAYIADADARFIPALEALRAAIRAAAPDAEEVLRMGAPTYLYHGNLVSFAAASKHCAFYVMSPGAITRHRTALEGFDTAPTAVRFGPDKPIPAKLVATIVKDRMRENEARRRR